MRQEGTLVEHLAERILEVARDEGLPPGAPLTERALAGTFRVSRTPVRSALALLHDQGRVDRTQSGRYRLGALAGLVPVKLDPVPTEDPLYLQVADDVVTGQLPARFTESELMRRYEESRPQIAALLRRMQDEGWAEPLPGYGWEIPPVVTSVEAYRAAYGYRLAVEPAGILQPTFVPDITLLRALRDEQQHLVDTLLAGVTAAEHFARNNRFHETIAGFSGNEFLLDGLIRVNRRRRLFEYRRELKAAAAAEKCAEHVRLAELLLAGEREAASAYLRDHISGAGEQKADDRAG